MKKIRVAKWYIFDLENFVFYNESLHILKYILIKKWIKFIIEVDKKISILIDEKIYNKIKSKQENNIINFIY